MVKLTFPFTEWNNMICNFQPSYFPVDESNERSAERLNEPQVSEMEDFESLFAQVDITTNCIFLFKKSIIFWISQL